MKSLLVVCPTVILIVVLLLGVPGSLPGQSTPPATPTRVAYVSAQRILVDSNLGKAETARVAEVQQQRTNELRPLAVELQATRAQLSKGGDEAALAKLQLQEQQQRLAFERATAQAQADMQNFQRQVQIDLQAKVRPIVEELAKARGFDIVLNSDSAVVWGTSATDLTPGVIERLNAK